MAGCKTCRERKEWLKKHKMGKVANAIEKAAKLVGVEPDPDAPPKRRTLGSKE